MREASSIRKIENQKRAVKLANLKINEKIKINEKLNDNKIN